MLTGEDVPVSHREKIVAAMSGGVDSSVASALLLDQGFDVIGITLLYYTCGEKMGRKSCCGNGIEAKASGIADSLGIPHYVLDYRKEFENHVLQYSWDEYSKGRTPNPCFVCNQKVRFGLLLDQAMRLGAAGIATGHYARVVRKEDGMPVLHRGIDKNKDQSYFLAGLNEEQLSRAVMPIGGLLKSEVRKIARRLGFPNADGEESQDACFIQEENSFSESLRKRFGIKVKHGAIIDGDGHKVGMHGGVHLFTIGQRRGLCTAFGRRAWVKTIDASTGTVFVTTNERDLVSDKLIASNIQWHQSVSNGEVLYCDAQVRYRQRAVPARVFKTGTGSAGVKFDSPVRAVTPGQAVVFYKGEEVIGSGWIDESC
jgi:tRNA-uridine 2-sulfurtransferase